MTIVENKQENSKSYSLEDWQKGYDSQPNEYDYYIDNIEGEIPKDLEGTLYRNGPGLFDIYGTSIAHPFDGDGMISAFKFKDGKCYFSNRFVKTKEYLEEKKAKKMLYRGVFGTQKPGGLLANIFDTRIKNIANTNVICLGDKLLALWEAAQPYCLDKNTLETIGLDNLNGVLKSGDSFSAHPRFDANSKFNNGKPSLVNFGIKVGLSSVITIYEFDLSGELIHQYSHKIKGFSFIHDFVITPNYCIFFQNPVTYNPFPFLFGLKGAGECVNFLENKPTKIIIIPRQYAPQNVKVLEVDAGFIFHHVNAFEQNNEIIVDSVSYSALTQIETNTSYKEVDFDKLAPGQLYRFSLNLNDNSVNKKQLNIRPCEFPVINPNNIGRNYRYIFIGATHNKTENAPLQALLKLDLYTGKTNLYSYAPNGFAGEPIFVPKSNAQSEDEGWVLHLIYDSANHCSKLVIFDGIDISQPVATLFLKNHIPYGLHGTWQG